jgi:hypothetical protein
LIYFTDEKAQIVIRQKPGSGTFLKTSWIPALGPRVTSRHL